MKDKNCLLCNKVMVSSYRCSHEYWEKRKYCGIPCRNKAWVLSITGKKQTEEHKKKRGEARRRFYDRVGRKTDVSTRIRNSPEYKIWRTAVFQRDNYTCQDCGIHTGGGHRVILNADHKKPFSLFPELRFEVSNGRTLCLNCHKMTKT